MVLDQLVVVVVAVLAASILAYVFLRKVVKKGDTVILLGDVGSGKTALFYQMLQGEFRETHTSMKLNSAKMIPAGLTQKEEYTYVDFPGHGSRRFELPQFFSSTRAIVIMVDATDASKAHGLAQNLYSLMTEASIAKRKIPILIAFNKQDILSEVVDEDAFKSKVRGYIEKTRHMQSDMSDIGSSDNVNDNIVSVGRDGQEFQYEHSPCPILFGKCSAKAGDLTAILDFLKGI